MAGFGKNQIAKTLTSESPFVQHMDAEQRTIYLNKGIAPCGEPSPGMAAGAAVSADAGDRGVDAAGDAPAGIP